MLQLFGSAIWSDSEEDGCRDLKSLIQDVGHRKDRVQDHSFLLLCDRKRKCVHGNSSYLPAT